MTSSRQETLYLLSRSLKTRGFEVTATTTGVFDVVHASGHFTLTVMPGNRRVLISSNSTIKTSEQGRGLGRKMLNLREDIAKEAGFNLLLATVRNDNAIEIHLLETSGWKRFTNRDTGVSLWGKELYGA